MTFGSDRWALYLPATFLVFLDLWWQTLPASPGLALAGVAFVGVVLLVRADVAPGWEKAVWLLLGLLLLAVEVHVAYAAHARARNVLVFRLVSPTEAIVEEQGTGSIRGATMAVADLAAYNKLASARVEDGSKYVPITEDVPLGDFTPGHPKSFAIRVRPPGSVARYRITFHTPEELWWEDLEATPTAGAPLQAFRLLSYRSLKPHVLLEHEDPGFARNAAGPVDWSWASRLPSNY